MITLLKIIFSLLLCCPLVYVGTLLFEKIVDEATGKH